MSHQGLGSEMCETDWPCHSKPKKEWCDHSGPGGFMGHTCRRIGRFNDFWWMTEFREEYMNMVFGASATAGHNHLQCLAGGWFAETAR